MESLSVNESGSVAEQDLSNLFGLEVDTGSEGATGFFAKNMVVTVFVLTKMAILETAQLFGLRGGLAKLDTMAFQIAQLKKQKEEINKKLDVFC